MNESRARVRDRGLFSIPGQGFNVLNYSVPYCKNCEMFFKI